MIKHPCTNEGDIPDTIEVAQDIIKALRQVNHVIS